MVILDANNGGLLYDIPLSVTKEGHYPETYNQFMLMNLKQSKSQFIMAINSEKLALNTPSITVKAYPESELPKDLDLDQESIFFTQIDKEGGVIKGYKVGAGFVAQKMWQINIANTETDKIHQVRSQMQTSSNIEHTHYLPTSSIGDNNMIYKYLDSNLFAVNTFDS